jgi:hypothetical protein
MKRLSPAKRNQLILTTVGTLVLVSLVYFFLIAPQHKLNLKLAADTISAQAKLDQIKKAISQAEANADKANEISTQLVQMEGDLATGDLFIWTYDTFRKFKSAYKVEIPTISHPVQSEVDLIPDFPYKQIKFSVQGTGYYQDIGKFIADLENNFPHLRVANLNLEPATGPGSGPEKLSFQMDVMALVKPNP